MTGARLTRTTRSKATWPSEAAAQVDGWTLFGHPVFIEALTRLTDAVAREKAKAPQTYASGANAKLLRAIFEFVFRKIPADPGAAMFRQGHTLGERHAHWRRAKFGNGRFRLFYRFDSASKIIIYAWVNDEKTRRTYGAKTDAYAVFQTMLRSGRPPDGWDDLLAEARRAPQAALRGEPPEA